MTTTPELITSSSVQLSDCQYGKVRACCPDRYTPLASWHASFAPCLHMHFHIALCRFVFPSYVQLNCHSAAQLLHRNALSRNSRCCLQKPRHAAASLPYAQSFQQRTVASQSP